MTRTTIEFEKKMLYLNFVYTLVSTIINQSAPKLAKIYMTTRSWKTLIIGLIGPVLLELSVIELGIKIIFDFVYTLVSTSINQSVPRVSDYVEMYMNRVD